MKRSLRVLGGTLLVLVLLGVLGWGVLALLYAGPSPPWLSKALALLYGAGGLLALIALRPLLRGALVVALGFAAVLVWWSTLRPSNDREWSADNLRTPWAEQDGDLLTVHDVRNFDYRSETDFTARYEDRTVDLSKLRGVDLFLVYWGSPLIAHTIMSWDFEGSPPIAISIETRKEGKEQYSAIAGFFRQYEILYVVADERDLVRLRTNYRGENVFLYRLNVPLDVARALLLDYVATINGLRDRPEWYNALTENCTTTIRMHTRRINNAGSFDWRMLANGYLDEMLYERGLVYTGMPFAELKTMSSVDWRGKAADQDPAFSERIREGLPDPRTASAP